MSVITLDEWMKSKRQALTPVLRTSVRRICDSASSIQASISLRKSGTMAPSNTILVAEVLDMAATLMRLTDTLEVTSDYLLDAFLTKKQR